MKRSFVGILLMTWMALGVSAAGVLAAQHDGIEMPDKMMVAGKELVLNGQGTRKATFLKVKVYVAGLYLETPSGDAGQILGSKQLKRLEMKFVRDVEKSKLISAFQEGKEKNCKVNCDLLQPSYDKLLSYVTDIKNGETMVFTFFPDHIEFEMKGAKHPPIEGDQIGPVLLAAWIGQYPPNEDLKEGLLGKK